jgi:hypothetical protein
VIDACGICGGDNTACADCAGIPSKYLFYCTPNNFYLKMAILLTMLVEYVTETTPHAQTVRESHMEPPKWIFVEFAEEMLIQMV